MANSQQSPTGQLPEWDDYMKDISAGMAEFLAQTRSPDDPQLRQEAYQVAWMTLVQGYLLLLNGDPAHPQLIPSMHTLYPLGVPNPDNLYYVTPLDENGTYHFTGFRGTTNFVDFQFNQSFPGLAKRSGARTGDFNLDQLTLGKDGAFSVIVSKKRPDGYTGDWIEMPADTGTVLVREVCGNWFTEEDARIAIDRLDTPVRKPRLTKEDIADKLGKLGTYLARFQDQFMTYEQSLRDMDLWNKIAIRIRKETGGAGTGGGLGGQTIYHGLFDLEDGECLLVETDLPEKVFYYNIQISENLHRSIDHFNTQTSLNNFQAHIDSDGRFRAVISNEDPGVPNWLDASGYKTGGIMGRWTRCSSAPLPVAKKIKLADLHKHIPSDTPKVTPQERDKHLRRRRVAMQLRRR